MGLLRNLHIGAIGVKIRKDRRVTIFLSTSQDFHRAIITSNTKWWCSFYQPQYEHSQHFQRATKALLNPGDIFSSNPDHGWQLMAIFWYFHYWAPVLRLVLTEVWLYHSLDSTDLVNLHRYKPARLPPGVTDFEVVKLFFLYEDQLMVVYIYKFL